MTHIARSALIIAVFFGLEKFLGFIRQLLIARQYGLSEELDVFYAANNLPDLIFALVSGGALAIAFIPALSEYLEKDGRPAMWNLFSRIANLVFLTTAFFSIIVAIFANHLVKWELGIAPGFNPNQQNLVVDLMRLNLISTLIFSISGLVIAGLQANQHFLLPALARSMYDVGTLIGIIILAPDNGYQVGPITLPALGLGVYGLVYGTIIGAVLFLGIQIPGLIHYKFHWIPRIDLHHPGVVKVIKLFLPRVATVFFIYLTLVYIPDNIASRLPEGSVTALAYGWLIMQLPETLIGTAIGTAMLPTLSERFILKDIQIFTTELNKAIRVILAFTLPTAAILAVILDPLVAIFGFGPAGTSLVVWVARAFLLGLAGHSLLEIGARGFYAQQNALIPLLASALMTITFIIFAYLFSTRYGAPGIALANTVAFTGEAILLLILLNRKFTGLLRVSGTLLRVFIAVIISMLLTYFLIGLPMGIPSILQALAAAGIGALATLPFIWSEIKLLTRL